MPYIIRAISRNEIHYLTGYVIRYWSWSKADAVEFEFVKAYSLLSALSDTKPGGGILYEAVEV